MTISYNHKVAITFGVATISLLLMPFISKPHRGLAGNFAPQITPNPAAEHSAIGSTPTNLLSIAPAFVAPFILQDTVNDSPGTNIVTRIVTFTAAIGGTPVPALQWKIDKGTGFVNIVGATNENLRIGNAQVLDSGSYALFATNSAGGIHTTPQSIAIIEGVD